MKMNTRTLKLIVAGFACALIAAFLVPSPRIDASGTYRGAVRDAVARLNGVLSKQSGQVSKVELRAAVVDLHRAVEATTAATEKRVCKPPCYCCGCGYFCSTGNPTGQVRPGMEEADALRALVAATQTSGPHISTESLRPLGAQLAAWAEH